ncbi:MAG: NADH-quinone oxidoreductase subunit F, partial [Planctomycetota bacterium]|nr:NADH-quinone oxidoreductase subunit F [Planctomycetota bacterium]
MQTPDKAGPPVTGMCWETPSKPVPELLDGLKAGPFAPARAAGAQQYEALLTALRREKLDKPLIFIGAGTCGLGAGAAKTLAAIRAWLSEQSFAADVVEVGCIGLCSEEPLVDIQLPGRTRVSFGGVSADLVPSLLNTVLRKQSIAADMVLGQFRGEQFKAWDGVPYLDQHPFLVRQRRVVLAASGIIDPGNIDEYIARGGYSALAKALKSQTPDEIC